MPDLDTDALVRYVERVEEKHDERRVLNAEIRAIYDEIRQAGMDAATVRVMVRERRLKADVRADQYRLRDQYRAALGLFADTPLGAAAERAFEDDLEAAAAVRPRPFAEQPVHPPRRPRGRRLRLFDTEHPQGTA